MYTVHTEEKAFQCEICDSSFKANADLKKHIAKVHEQRVEDKKFKCHICAYSSSEKRAMI